MRKCQSPCRLSWTSARSDGPQGSAGGSGLPGSGCGWVCVHGLAGISGGLGRGGPQCGSATGERSHPVCEIGRPPHHRHSCCARGSALALAWTGSTLWPARWVRLMMNSTWINLIRSAASNKDKFILLEPTVPMWRLICHLVTTARSKHNYVHNALSER